MKEWGISVPIEDNPFYNKIKDQIQQAIINAGNYDALVALGIIVEPDLDEVVIEYPEYEG